MLLSARLSVNMGVLNQLNRLRVTVKTMEGSMISITRREQKSNSWKSWISRLKDSAEILQQ